MAARPASSRPRASPSTRFRPRTNIGEMMVKGELDATLLYLTNTNLVDRSRIDLSKDNRFRPLFDRAAEGKRYFAKTGIYQINHGMVIRRSIFEKSSVGRAQHLQRLRQGARRGYPRPRHRAAPALRAGPDRRRRAQGAGDRSDGLWGARQPQGAGDHHPVCPRAGSERPPRRRWRRCSRRAPWICRPAKRPPPPTGRGCVNHLSIGKYVS